MPSDVPVREPTNNLVWNVGEKHQVKRTHLCPHCHFCQSTMKVELECRGVLPAEMIPAEFDVNDDQAKWQARVRCSCDEDVIIIEGIGPFVTRLETIMEEVCNSVELCQTTKHQRGL